MKKLLTLLLKQCSMLDNKGRVEVAPQLVWVSNPHMMRSDVAITTKGSMQVCRQVYAVSE